ncbi:MAG: helix-turn-helix domain-containing protein [Negativicutes bacterium]|nr:helix-turn-helix domain-containing protein [Negativicutes bacterium]
MLGEKLKSLREQKGITQQEMADILGIARGTYAHYEIDRREPDNATLARLADFFGVTTDYLLGRTDNPSDPNAEAIAKIDDALAGDPELLAFWEETKKRPDLQLFLKQVKSATPKAIKQMIAIIKAIEDEEANE